MAKKPEDGKQDDQILEKYLQGDSALSRTYGAEGKAQVPTHLDKVILSAAGEAVRSKPQSKLAYSPFARSWYVPASMAAVLMLCVGLVFTIYKDSGQTLLTAPKSEYDIDVQTVPVETVKSIERDRINTAGEKNRKYKDEDDAIPMDMIREANKAVPSSIELYEAEEPEPEESKLEKRPTSKILLREKVMEMDADIQLEMTDKNIPKKDTLEQTLSDTPYLPERQDDLRRLESADVKKQKKFDADVMNNKLGTMGLKDNEEEAEIGASSASTLRYRQAKESFAKGKRTVEEESLDNITVEGLVSPARSSADEMMSAEQWLKQINELWLSGDHQAAKEGLNQFLVAYPDYPKEKIKMILDADSGLIDYLR
jgi:hypothetical protein